LKKEANKAGRSIIYKISSYALGILIECAAVVTISLAALLLMFIIKAIVP